MHLTPHDAHVTTRVRAAHQRSAPELALSLPPRANLTIGTGMSDVFDHRAAPTADVSEPSSARQIFEHLQVTPSYSAALANIKGWVCTMRSFLRSTRVPGDGPPT